MHLTHLFRLFSTTGKRYQKTCLYRARVDEEMLATNPIKFLQPVEVKAILQDPHRRPKTLVLDVRDEDFGDCGHIRGCVNVPSYQLTTQDELDSFIDRHLTAPVNTVIVHCYLSQQRGPSCARRCVLGSSVYHAHTLSCTILFKNRRIAMIS
jgi:hypothetical protein